MSSTTSANISKASMLMIYSAHGSWPTVKFDPVKFDPETVNEAVRLAIELLKETEQFDG